MIAPISLLLSAAAGSLRPPILTRMEALAAKVFAEGRAQLHGPFWDVLEELWEESVRSWRRSLASPGLLSWITGTPSCPDLLPSAHFAACPHLAYFAISVQGQTILWTNTLFWRLIRALILPSKLTMKLLSRLRREDHRLVENYRCEVENCCDCC